MKYGPQTPEIEALIEKVKNLTPEQADRLKEAWNTACGTEWGAWLRATATSQASFYGAALIAIYDAVRGNDVAKGVPLYSARAALLALLVKDRISEKNFNILYEPWGSVMDHE